MADDAPSLAKTPKTAAAGPRQEKPRTLPQRLRRLVQRGARQAVLALTRQRLRNNDLAVIVISAVLGGAIGLGVILLYDGLVYLQHVAFALEPGGRLGESGNLQPWRVLAMPAAGGLAVGLLGYVMHRLRRREIVDPIEANALYGGRMSLIESLRLAVSTLLSSGFGASVGMEAAYTQMGSGIASAVGQRLHLRRSDLRILVGAGTAAAFAAAFNAPLAGAFYAFELVIGSYAPAALAPVSVAAVAAALVGRTTFGIDPIFSVPHGIVVGNADYMLFAIVGLLSGGLGILVMQAVTKTERGFRRLPLPGWARPALGGLVLGVVALAFPQVLGSGQNAIQHHFDTSLDLGLLAALIVAKVAASAVSIGSGFRGGLFSSSLLLGSLFGSGLALLLAPILPGAADDRLMLMLVGMGSVTAAVVGAPVAMILLVLEITGDFTATVAVLVGVVTASTLVRQSFGYSFSTWRFHLRGVPIRGAHDIGWIEDLTVARLMRRDPSVVDATTPVAELRRLFPAGSSKRVFVADAEGKYAGLIEVAAIHDPALDDEVDEKTASDLAQCQSHYLLPRFNIRTALKGFVDAETETLAVVQTPLDRRVVGYLTEAYALRRYAQELERQRADELGERNLFGPG